MTFESLAAFIVQSCVVVLLALVIERFLPRHDAVSRWGLWAFALVSGVIWPMALAFLLHGGAPQAVDTIVFSVEAASRAAPAEAKLGFVWAAIAGGLLLAAWRLCGLWRLHGYVAASQPLAIGPELAGEIAVLENKTRARADYRVSDSVEGPLVYSLHNPVVVLPAGFGAMPSEQRVPILAHELTHVRRHDFLKLLLEEALRCAVWFTPAIHIILRKLRVVREMTADASALEVTHDRQSYLAALVEIARRPIQADGLVAPLFLEPRSLKQRVAALLEEHPVSKARRIVALAAILLLIPMAGRWARDAFPANLRAAQGTIHKVGGDVKAPRLLTKVEPEYTDEASEVKIEGTVVLSVEVHPDGRPYNIRVERSLDRGLDYNAIKAVEQWTFEPGTKNGEPVTVAATIEVNFKVR